eukprot:scaffold3410_cov141-Cylindrotheca_fusiformis.AAC.16
MASPDREPDAYPLSSARMYGQLTTKYLRMVLNCNKMRIDPSTSTHSPLGGSEYKSVPCPKTTWPAWGRKASEIRRNDNNNHSVYTALLPPIGVAKIYNTLDRRPIIHLQKERA